MPTRRDVLVGSVLAGLSVALPGLAAAADVVRFTGELEVERIDVARVRLRAWATGDGDVVLASEARSAAVSIRSLNVDGQAPEEMLLEPELRPPGCTSRASPRRMDVVVTKGMRLGSRWRTVDAAPGAVIDAVVTVVHRDGGAEMPLAAEAPPWPVEPEPTPIVRDRDVQE